MAFITDDQQWNFGNFPDGNPMREIVGTFFLQDEGFVNQLGSGFILQTTGRSVTICTAGHVLKDAANRFQPDYVRHQSTVVVDFQKARPIVKLGRLHFLIEQSCVPIPLYVTNCVWDEEKDLGFATADYPPGYSPHASPFVVKLDDRPPKLGDTMAIFGFARMKEWPAFEGASYGTLARLPSLRFGRISDVLPKGTPLARAPQFRCTAPIEDGMSGSLAALVEFGGEIRAVGVACASPDGKPMTDRTISADSTVLSLSPFVKRIDQNRAVLELPFLFSGIGSTK